MRKYKEELEKLQECYMQSRRENMNYENIIANLRLLLRRSISRGDDGSPIIIASDYGDWVLYDDMMYFINGQTGCNVGSEQ